MKNSLRILYVGPMWEGGTCLQRMKVLREFGHNIVEIDTQPEQVRLAEKSLFYRIRGKLFRSGLNMFGLPDLAGVNSQIAEITKKSQGWNILWIDKVLTIEAQTLNQVKAACPKCIIVGYSPDDMFARHNQSRQFLQSLPIYDIYFTTKSYGVAELKSLGCKRAEFIGNAYDPNTHKPVPVSDEERKKLGGGAGFIGQWEPERAASMLKMAKAGIPVRIWGYTWEKFKERHHNLILENRPLWGQDYAKAICAFDINLTFLRKINRDLQTSRSIEIPACGAFMLAERTDEHLALFEEGKEAGFFGSDEELVDKVRYYLAHPEERKCIAAAGRERCLKSGYSYQDRLKQMLNAIESLM